MWNLSSDCLLFSPPVQKFKWRLTESKACWVRGNPRISDFIQGLLLCTWFLPAQQPINGPVISVCASRATVHFPCSWHRSWYSMSGLNILSWVLWEKKQQHSQVMAIVTTLVYNSLAQMSQRLTKSINSFAVVEDSYSVGNDFMRGKSFAHY